jgi:hypothetical protein
MLAQRCRAACAGTSISGRHRRARLKHAPLLQGGPGPYVEHSVYANILSAAIAVLRATCLQRQDQSHARTRSRARRYQSMRALA